MAYRNRELIRKPHSMLRTNALEQEKLDFLVEHYGGGAPAEIFRDLLLKLADQKIHEANSLSPSRVPGSVDKNAFGGSLRAA